MALTVKIVMKQTKIKDMNKQKFVHNVMVTFTYSVGVSAFGMLVFSLVTLIKNI